MKKSRDLKRHLRAFFRYASVRYATEHKRNLASFESFDAVLAEAKRTLQHVQTLDDRQEPGMGASAAPLRSPQLPPSLA